MNEDYPGKIHRQQYGRSDKANAPENQNADWQEGYAWGIETFAYDPTLILQAELKTPWRVRADWQWIQRVEKRFLGRAHADESSQNQEEAHRRKPPGTHTHIGKTNDVQNLH